MSLEGRKGRRAPLLLGLLFLASTPDAAGAAPQELSAAELDQRTAEVAAELRCPVCRNQSVLESSSGLAREMQSVIRDRLAAGESPEDVREYFVGRYGDWILLKPEPKGINLLVYLLPAVALLGGAGLLVRQIRRWTGATTASGGTAESVVIPGGPAPVEDAAGRDNDQPAAGTAGSLSKEEEDWIRRQMESVH